jgi:organic radical activating enzyme
MRISSLRAAELKSFINDGFDVYLFGAGTAVSSYARIAFAALKSLDIEFTAFLDDDSNRVGTDFLGKKILGISSLQHPERAVILISSNYFRSILRNNPILASCFSVSSLVGVFENTPASAFRGLMSYEEAQRRLRTHRSKLAQVQGFSKENVFVNALDVQVTEKCSMKCVDCSNLMQYYQSPKDSDTTTLLVALENFLNAIDFLADARVIGGEPFLVRDLDRVINFLQDQSKVGHITIYTNGTIVPRPDVLASLKGSKVVVEITDYDSLSRKHEQLVSKLTDENIQFFSHRPQNWTDSARIVKNSLSSPKLAEMFDACCVNDALTLLHGKLFHCPFSANAVNLGAFKPSVTESIDLLIPHDNLRDFFSSWYFGRPYLEACQYCLGRDYLQPQVTPGVQTKKPIPIPVIAA